MKKEKKTELVFILDRSGSMTGLEKDTIGGFNGMLKKQQKEKGEVRVTTVLFDDQYELLHDRLSLEEVPPLTEEEYYVRGMTALHDALGKTLLKIKSVQKNTKEAMAAEQVLFVIMTDGYENASREFDARKIKALIEEQKKEGWEFLFLGANIDAVQTASHYGIDAKRASNFHNDEKGVALNFSTLHETLSNYRSQGKLNDHWKEEIERDYAQRKNSTSS